MGLKSFSLIVLGIAGVSLLFMWRRLRQAEPVGAVENKISPPDHAQIENMGEHKNDLDMVAMSCDFVDREEMLGDPELAPLLHRFESGLVAQLETWRELLQQEDWEELQRLMHRLQGAAGVYCHSQLSEASRQAENALKEIRLEDFKVYFQHIEKYIDGFAEKYLT